MVTLRTRPGNPRGLVPLERLLARHSAARCWAGARRVACYHLGAPIFEGAQKVGHLGLRAGELVLHLVAILDAILCPLHHDPGAPIGIARDGQRPLLGPEKGLERTQGG